MELSKKIFWLCLGYFVGHKIMRTALGTVELRARMDEIESVLAEYKSIK